ncbi:MAG TPA: ABC transporter permease [Mycobacteriales bacterium]|jgi:NitT/TauT family transport system permease protein|nr:ABC transporter permease [Mycobacteriales bacterium]
MPDALATLEAGLDALEAPEPAPRRARRWLRVLPPFVAVALLVGLWQLAYALHLKSPEAMPSPADVARALAEQWGKGTVQEAVLNSLHRGVLGFLASIAVGTPLGLLIARVKPVRLAIGPIFSGLQSLPSVAWVPAAIIWFGLSDAAIYFVVLMGAVPSIANGLVAGIDQVPPLYLKVGRVLGAKRLTAARHVIVPAALPGYLAGLKQGWAFSWRSLMAAELITFSPRLGLGLGQLLETGRELSDMSLVVASIIVILAVGVGIELLVFAPLERRVLARRGLAQAA